MNSHHLLRLSSMQFGLDDRVAEPLVPLPPPPSASPAKKRWWRSRSGPPTDPEPAHDDRQPIEGGRR